MSLIDAATKGNLDSVKELVDCGADIDAKDWVRVIV